MTILYYSCFTMMLLRKVLLSPTTRYLGPRVDMTLFYCSFEVMRSDVGVETVP